MSLSAGYVEVEPDRTSAVQSDFGDLVWPRTEDSRDRVRIYSSHDDPNRSDGDRNAIRENVRNGSQSLQSGIQRDPTHPPRSLLTMELHHTPASEKHGIVFGQVLSRLVYDGLPGRRFVVLALDGLERPSYATPLK